MSRLVIIILLCALATSCEDEPEKCAAKYVNAWNTGGVANDYFAVFDSDNRVKEVYTVGELGHSVVMTFEYDSEGRLLTISRDGRFHRYYYFGTTHFVSVNSADEDVLFLEKRFHHENGRMYKIEEYEPESSDLVIKLYRLYTYTGDNVTSEEVYERIAGTPDYDNKYSITYEYDNKPLPFSEAIFPSFAFHPPRVNNIASITIRSGNNIFSKTSFVYEYNRSGYPIKKKLVNEHGTPELLMEFEYKCEPRTAP
jgi:YD repeat-containing protein